MMDGYVAGSKNIAETVISDLCYRLLLTNALINSFESDKCCAFAALCVLQFCAFTVHLNV